MPFFSPKHALAEFEFSFLLQSQRNPYPYTLRMNFELKISIRKTLFDTVFKQRIIEVRLRRRQDRLNAAKNHTKQGIPSIL